MSEIENAYWNGEPTRARHCKVQVIDKGTFPQYWARLEGLVGTVQPAVEVVVDPVLGLRSYLDNRNGEGLEKVTTGKGSPRWGHKSFEVAEVYYD